MSRSGTPLSTPLPRSGSNPYRRWFLVAALVVGGVLAYLLRGVLVPLFFAFLLAYALDPFVDRLEKARVPRPLGALLVMASLSLIAASVLVIAVPYFIDEFRDAGDQLPAQIEAMRERFDPWVSQMFHVSLPHTWSELAAKLASEVQSRAPDLAQGAAVALFGTLNIILIVVGTLIVPVFALYLLIDFHRIVERLNRLIPRRWTPAVVSIAGEIHGALGGYVRGQLTASLVLGTLYALGLWMVGIRLAIPIGVITGLLAFVPYVGFGMGMLMAVTMALLDWHGGNQVMEAVAVMLSVQALDGTIITPRIVGQSVGLRPIEVLLTMMAAATLFGFLGVLLAVPLGATVKIVVSRIANVYLASEFYRRPPSPSHVDLTEALSMPPARRSGSLPPPAPTLPASTPSSPGAPIAPPLAPASVSNLAAAATVPPLPPLGILPDAENMTPPPAPLAAEPPQTGPVSPALGIPASRRTIRDV